MRTLPLSPITLPSPTHTINKTYLQHPPHALHSEVKVVLGVPILTDLFCTSLPVPTPTVLAAYVRPSIPTHPRKPTARPATTLPLLSAPALYTIQCTPSHCSPGHAGGPKRCRQLLQHLLSEFQYSRWPQNREASSEAARVRSSTATITVQRSQLGPISAEPAT